MRDKVFLSLSGGMDSATLLSYFLETREVQPISFSYGSKHNKWEKEAAVKVADYYGLNLLHIDLPFIGELYKSNLLKTGDAIPEGHYEADNMKLTVVPGRNTLFISILLGLAQSEGGGIIALGVHAGDHTIYPDCRAEYIKQISGAVLLASESTVSLQTPFIFMTKSHILILGHELKTPYHLTRTCYKDQPLSCGKCGACQERLEAFKLIKEEDTIEYDNKMVV